MTSASIPRRAPLRGTFDSIHHVGAESVSRLRALNSSDKRRRRHIRAAMRRAQDRRYHEALATLHLARQLYRSHVRHLREYRRYARRREWFALHRPPPTKFEDLPTDIQGLIVQHTNQADLHHSRSDDGSASVHNLRAVNSELRDAVDTHGIAKYRSHGMLGHVGPWIHEARIRLRFRSQWRDERNLVLDKMMSRGIQDT
jgi:hypothetical protein